MGGILVGNSKSTDFCTPINHYYWNVPEGIRRMNQLHTQPNFEMEKEKRKKRGKRKKIKRGRGKERERKRED